MLQIELVCVNTTCVLFQAFLMHNRDLIAELHTTNTIAIHTNTLMYEKQTNIKKCIHIQVHITIET